MNTLALLDWDLAVTQQDMTTAEDFANLCTSRGVSIDLTGLESLHRQGILIPFYVIRYSATAIQRRDPVGGDRISPRDMQNVLHSVSTRRESLLEERQVGDLADPMRGPYRPWHVSGSYRSTPYRRRRHLYSPYQAVGVRELLMSFPGGDPTTLEGASGRRRRGSQGHRRRLRELGTVLRNRAMLLSLLETAYRPEIVPNLRGFDLNVTKWSSYRREFRAEDAVAASGFGVPDLRSIAETLLAEAHSFDPIADWIDLVSLMHHGRWERLTGLARLALDYRVAAEMLLLAQQDLAIRGLDSELAEPSGNWWTPLHDRLRPRRDRLNRTLTRYGLSPHPSVLVVVEGKTELELISGYLDARLRQGWRNSIQFLDAQGVDRDVTAVASLVAPMTGVRHGEGAFLDRPPTRILIVSDPEGRREGEQGRAHLKSTWVDRLVESLPADLRSAAARTELAGLVEVEVWNESGSSFEFAHFTDGQLAEAIGAVSRSPSTPLANSLEVAIRDARRDRKNLKSIWSRWSPPHPNKLQIARYLEPAFQASVTDSLETGLDEFRVPAARVIARILQLASLTPRHAQTILRVADEPRSDE